MERILSYKKVNDYLQQLAQKHVDIQDFCGTSIDELESKINSTLGLLSPALVFINISSKLSGNTQRTFNQRSIFFSIVISGIKQDDFQGRIDAVSLSEQIGLEVLSRIEYDSKIESSGWLYKNFLKESVSFSEFDPKGAEGFVGMDFNFDLKTLEPLIVDPAKWTDGNAICN